MESNNDIEKNDSVDSVNDKDVQDIQEKSGKEEIPESPTQAQTIADQQTYEQLVEQVTSVNIHLDTITNLLIVTMVGIGIIAGILCNQIFSRYFSS